MKNYIILLLSLMCVVAQAQQSKVELRLNHINTSQSEQCFDLELRSPYNEDIKLAGQNYRLFYDASKAEVIKEKTTLSLDQEAYSKTDMISSIHGDVGFLSLSVDARANTDQTINVDKSGEWTRVGKACFMPTTQKGFDVIWANERTEYYASAQVTLSKWVDEEEQAVLDPELMIDYTQAHNTISEDISMEVFPNPVVDRVQIAIDRQESTVDILIKDVIGREVVYDSVDGKSVSDYDLSGWPAGRYTVELIADSGEIFTKSIIKTDNN